MAKYVNPQAMPSPPASILGIKRHLESDFQVENANKKIKLLSLGCESTRTSTPPGFEDEQLLTPVSQQDEQVVVAESQCSQGDKIGIDAKFKATTRNILRLLNSQIRFVPASLLTLHDERFNRKSRRALENLSDEHAMRRRRVLSLDPGPRCLGKPPGFPNPRNYCYRRSVMQGLLNLSSFVDYSSTHAEEAKCSPKCLLCLFHEISKQRCVGKSSVNEAVNGLDLGIRSLRPGWARNKSQADAHEFLIELLNAFGTRTSERSPLVESLFCVNILRNWTCQDCATVSSPALSDEIGFSIPLRIPKHPKGLQDLLDSFLGLDPTPGVRCETCNTRKERQRISRINAAPQILIVQLCRFEVTRRGTMSKIDTAVKIPKFLDLSKHAQNSTFRKSRQLKYKLSSVISHQGALSSGHYVCWAQTSDHKYWKFNDSIVTAATFDEMVRPADGFTPYILFYANVSSSEVNTGEA